MVSLEPSTDIGEDEVAGLPARYANGNGAENQDSSQHRKGTTQESAPKLTEGVSVGSDYQYCRGHKPKLHT